MTDSLSGLHHLIDDPDNEDRWRSDDIYRSSNGDVWRLLRDVSSTRAFVRHTSNQSSGGSVHDVTVEEFLAVNGSGPEHGALQILLAKLAPSG